MEAYKIRLGAKNKSIIYADSEGVYRFNVALNNREWSIYLPGSKGAGYRYYVMSITEEHRVLGRIIPFLQRVKWFGVFPVRYSVIVVRRVPE